MYSYKYMYSTSYILLREHLRSQSDMPGLKSATFYIYL